MSISEFAHRAPVRCWVGLVLVLALAGLASAQLTHPFRVDGLDGTNGVRLVGGGFEYGGWQGMGSRVVGIGDVNGDGYEDFAAWMLGEKTTYTVLVNRWEFRTISEYRGHVEVILGRAERWPSGSATIESLRTSHAFAIVGRERDSNLGRYNLSGVGDVNGDGFSDFIASARNFYDPVDRAVYLIFGQSDFHQIPNRTVADLPQSVRFTYSHPYYSHGVLAFPVGDVDGDGLDDLFLVSDWPWESTAGFRSGDIIYGRRDGWPADVDLRDSAAGGRRTRVVGTYDNFYNSYAVIAGLGDVNGDGLDDFALGSPCINGPGADQPGSVYVVFGSRGGFGDNLDVSGLDGSNGYRIDGWSRNDFFGSAIVPVGDIHGTGRNAFLLAAPGYRPETAGPNEANWGRVDLFSDVPTTNGMLLAIAGASEASHAGYFGGKEDRIGSSAGLWGYDHIGSPILAIGGSHVPFPRDYRPAGSVYLIPHKPDDTTEPLNLRLFEERHGIRLFRKIDSQFGTSLASGFDFDGDGMLDGVVGAPNAGELALVYGFDGPTSLTLRRYVAPGDAPTAGVGMLGNGSHTIPHSRLWITFGSGDDGNGGASLVTVTVNRTTEGLTNLPGPAADVQWIGDWDRPGWDGAYITVKYLDSEIVGINPERLRLFYSETPNGPWTESEHGFVDTRRKRVGGVVWSKGYYILADRSPLSGDLNRDGVLTPVDAQWAFDCALGACPPDADTEAGDLCPPYGVLTPADSQGIFYRFIGLRLCP